MAPRILSRTDDTLKRRNTTFLSSLLMSYLNEIDLLAEITEDNIFLRRYPTMKSYVKALRSLGVIGDRPEDSDPCVFDFYANHIDPEDVAVIWETYN